MIAAFSRFRPSGPGNPSSGRTFVEEKHSLVEPDMEPVVLVTTLDANLLAAENVDWRN